MQFAKLPKCSVFISVALLFAVALDSGLTLQCYKCDPCPSDTSTYTTQSCNEGEDCLSLSINLEQYGIQIGGTSKGCANNSLTCDDIVYADLNKQRNQLQPDLQAVFDQQLANIKCNFCKDDLCNL